MNLMVTLKPTSWRSTYTAKPLTGGASEMVSLPSLKVNVPGLRHDLISDMDCVSLSLESQSCAIGPLVTVAVYMYNDPY